MLILVGLNHRTAPVEVREKLAFSREEAEAVSAGLRTLEGMEELVLLSTCNRTEVLAAAGNGIGPDTARRIIRDYLGKSRSLEPSEIDRYLYSHHGLNAVRHLFRVASSLDSMMVGEPQILGQVKEAYNVAAQAGSLGPRLDPLLQRAFAVAKKIRTQTQISRNPVSVAYAATDLAGKIFGSLANRSVMILGAGKMADLAARHLMRFGVQSILVASRTLHHARDLAQSYNGVPITLDRFREHLPTVDIVISSTAAPHYILSKDDGLRLMKARRGRPIFFVDIAVPRDIDPGLNDIDNVYLYNIDDLQKVVDSGVEERRREAVRAEEIIESEVMQFQARAGAREAAPTIVALREKIHRLAEEELQRFRSGLGPLTAEQERTLRAMMSSLVNKVLHGPTREAKKAGASPAGADAIELIRRMFGLEGPRRESGKEGPDK